MAQFHQIVKRQALVEVNGPVAFGFDEVLGKQQAQARGIRPRAKTACSVCRAFAFAASPITGGYQFLAHQAGR